MKTQLIAFSSQFHVPHACPVLVRHASEHAKRAFVQSHSDESAFAALKQLHSHHHLSHFAMPVRGQGRARLLAALNQCSGTALLIAPGTPLAKSLGAGHGKGGGSGPGKQSEAEGKSTGKSGNEPEENPDEKGQLVGLEMQCGHAEADEQEEDGADKQGHKGTAPHGGKSTTPAKSKSQTAHSHKRKPRWAKNGEVLCIVPPSAGTDTVKFKAQTVKEPDWVSWTGKGWKGFEHKGEEYEFKIPGYPLNSVLDLLPVNGIWGANAPPKVINVEAVDQDGHKFGGKIAVYSDHKSNIKGTFWKSDRAKHAEEEKKAKEEHAEGGSEHEHAQQVFQTIIDLADNIQAGLKKIPLMPVKPEIMWPQGTYHLTVMHKEDEETNEVFVYVDLGLALDPLIGIKLEYEVPIFQILKIVPKKIQENVADISASFGVEGKLTMGLSIGRLKNHDLNAQGSFGGAVGVGLDFKAVLFAKKILKVVCHAGSEIGATYNILNEGIGPGNHLKIGGKGEVVFEGLVGSLKFDLLDGVMNYENEWKFLDRKELYTFFIRELVK